MKRLLLISACLILVGVGCSKNTPTIPVVNETTKNVATETIDQPLVEKNVPAPILPPKQTPASIAEIVKSNPPATKPDGIINLPVANTETTYTISNIAKYNTPSKCWTIVNDNAYDVTSYAPIHPGGSDEIYAICGKDGSSLFNNQHGSKQKIADQLKKYYLGKVAK
jgi:cytochrome b involved in lipid metabolism